MSRDTHILLIETATRNCSVALCRNGVVLEEIGESAEHFIHAEKLHVFIGQLFSRQGMDPRELQAVAVSKGPGSYTGLRIGVSAAKGFAFALDIPLIALHTLEIMCDYGRQHYPGFDLYTAMLDARREEVYHLVTDSEGQILMTTSAMIIGDESFQYTAKGKNLFIGDGVEKSRVHLPPNSEILPWLPKASMMARLANQYYQNGIFEDLDAFEPFYLKEFLPGVAKRSILN